MTSSQSSLQKTAPRWRTWLRRIFMALGILIIVVIFFVIPFGLSWLLTHAKSRPLKYEVVATPEDYGVAYQTVKFTASDGTPLSGWWLPADSSSAVLIYCHGLFRSKLEMVERACHFRKRGYAGLVLDFRRHGDSGGELCSMGYLERLDVLAAIHFVRDSLQIKKPIVTFAVSMGTAASMLAAAESPEIAGLILDSSFLSFENTIAHHAKLFFGLPRFPLADEIIFFTRMLVGFDNEDFDMLIALDKIGDRPLLFIAGDNDERMPVSIQHQLYEHAKSTRKKFALVAGARHGAAFRTDQALYEREVLDFFAAHFEQNTPAGAAQASPRASSR